MRKRFTFLGSGASSGIPMIGCTCSVCTSQNPKNQRLRSSGLLEIGEKRLLIDAGPDIRSQALRAKIDSLDGLILTHTHFDHIAGIDELRVFFLKTGRSLPCLLSKESFRDLEDRYAYIVNPNQDIPNLSAKFSFEVLDSDFGFTKFLGLKFGFTSYYQGGMKVNGYRIGNFAYISDIKNYDDSIFSFLEGVDHLVLSALRDRASPIHFNLEEAIAFSQKVGAKETRLTHIAHELEHDFVNLSLPPSIQLGYDGLQMEFEIE